MRSVSVRQDPISDLIFPRVYFQFFFGISMMLLAVHRQILAWISSFPFFTIYIRQLYFVKNEKDEIWVKFAYILTGSILMLKKLDIHMWNSEIRFHISHHRRGKVTYVLRNTSILMWISGCPHFIRISTLSKNSYVLYTVFIPKKFCLIVPENSCFLK